MSTELLYLTDAYQRSARAEVTHVDGTRVALDRTVFYPTGGGQPYDTGTLTWPGGSARVTEVRKEGDTVWHALDGDVPPAGTEVTAEIDWDRRHQLLHPGAEALGGGVELEVHAGAQGLHVAAGHRHPPLVPDDTAQDVEGGVGAHEPVAPVPVDLGRHLGARRGHVAVSFIPRAEAVLDEALIRTKVSLVPESVREIRVVDIVGLDKQADGGTHVRSTAEVGRVRVVKTESKGKGNKRVRIEVTD